MVQQQRGREREQEQEQERLYSPERDEYHLADSVAESSDYSSSEDSLFAILRRKAPSRFQQHLLVGSLCANVVLLTALLFIIVSRPSRPLDTVQIPSLSGIKYNQITTYHHHSPYWGSNDSLADALWEELSTDPIVVAVPDEWAQQHNLPRSARWPWDPTRGRYFIRGFHELHCLKYVRRYTTDIQRTGETSLVGSHVLHCLDSLRQSVMCRADDTLMPTSDDTSFAIGDSAQIQCRDWDELASWAFESERNACHRSLDDYRTIRHSIERYAFCPEWSPYKDVADGYFDEHGHQSAWNTSD